VLLIGSAFPCVAAAAAPANPIVTENARPGTTAWQGRLFCCAELYGTEITAAPGDQIHLHVSTSARYRIVVYRLGWYGGAGARQLACLPSCTEDKQGRVQTGADPPSVQPARANWPVTDVVQTGSDWTSGYYLVEAVLTSTSATPLVATTYFILRQPPVAQPSQILVQVPVNTWEAYNAWGGRSLYNFTSERAYAVSFERPFDHQAATPLWWEIQLVRFLEREGYDVSYTTDIDTDANPESLLLHRLVMVAGHDEYWTLAIRDAFDAALAGGTNLAFMGSNDAYWNIEYRDGGQTVWTYKSTYDPNPDPTKKTAMFREIGRPECLLEGVQHADIRVLDHPLDYAVTSAGANDPWLLGTGFQTGDIIAGVVGREHDTLTDYPGCVHPGETVLFHYDGRGVDLNGDAIRYTAPSGARVFASGAQEFSWALDSWRSDDTLAPSTPVGADRSAPVDPRVQQFMRNALDDLTRPAAPAAVLTSRVTGGVRVRTGKPLDPRVVGRLVFRLRDADPAQLVCQGRGRCVVPRAKTPGTYRFEAEYVDIWGRTSAPTLSKPWTKG
jgi:hypothetical protein